MTNNIRRKLAAALLFIELSTFTGCNNKTTVPCNVRTEHIHAYRLDSNEISITIYLKGEYEKKGSFYRTDEYIDSTPENNIMCDNNFYRVEDNIEYLNMLEKELPKPKRQEYVYVGSSIYFGPGLGYNPSTGKVENFVGLHPERMDDNYEWRNISLDEYTNNRVRDIYVGFNLYRINTDGTIEKGFFSTIEEGLEKGFKYYRDLDPTEKIITEPYYLKNTASKSK